MASLAPVPVHNHSEYSALDGRSTVKEIADRIVELDMPGAFLTDHGTVAGLWHFDKAMRERGLYVGFGMEAYQARDSRGDKQIKPGDWRLKKDKNPPKEPRAFKKGEDSFHLILLAKNNEGYRNLLRISNEAFRTGFYYDPRLDYELLRKYREGLICTTACLGSLPNRALLDNDDDSHFADLGRIFGEDLYLELHTYDTDECRELNKRLVSISNDKGYNVVYANDAHYAWPEEYVVHEMTLCAQQGGKKFHDPKLRDGKPSYPPNPKMHHPPSLYIMGEADVRAALSHLPEKWVDEAINNSNVLMQKCQVQLEKPGQFLPKFKSNKTESARSLFCDLVKQGIIDKYGYGEEEGITEEVWERAFYEMEAILGAGLHDYFLIVWDFCHWADNQGIMRGPGRGSAGGSIVAHALDITHIDPIEYNLQFERFWNPGRADGLPDIDVDFEKERIEEVREYVRTKYGEDKVVRIGNHMRMGPKAAIDKAGMVLFDRPPYGLMDASKRIIETTTDAGQSKTWDEMWAQLGEWAEQDGEPHPLERYYDAEPVLFDLAREMSGRISGYGIHASAVVISSVPVADRLPVRSTAEEGSSKRELVTQAEMKQVEKEGFPKFDFLGLRNLDTIMLTALLSGDFGEDNRETRRKIARYFRHDINYNHLADGYFEQIDKKHTLGLFQIEDGRSARSIGKQIKPRSVEELALIVALNRPGPLRSKDESGRNMIERFVARREGKEETVYPHVILDEILQATYGDFLYQEQVIAYFRAIGYNLSDADHIRKILGKKLVKEMREEMPKYLALAEQFMPRAVAEHIWSLIEAFSKYSFNKAHAVGYALILAWTLYAKRKWPLEFIMASIMTVTKTERIPDFIREAYRIGAKVLPPDVMISQHEISRTTDAIIWGLADIKGVGVPAAKWIVQNRKRFKEAEDAVRLVDETAACPCNKGHLKKMIAAGAFDSFGYRLVECATCEGQGKVRHMVPTKKDPEKLKASWQPCTDCVLGFVRVDLPPAEEIVAAQEEYLGIMLTNPNQGLIDKYEEELEALDPISDADIDDGRIVTVPGVVVEVMKKKTGPNAWSPNEDYANVTIEWKGERIRFVAWPKEYKNSLTLLKQHRLGRFTLKTGAKGPKLQKGKPYLD